MIYSMLDNQDLLIDDIFVANIINLFSFYMIWS